MSCARLLAKRHVFVSSLSDCKACFFKMSTGRRRKLMQKEAKLSTNSRAKNEVSNSDNTVSESDSSSSETESKYFKRDTVVVSAGDNLDAKISNEASETKGFPVKASISSDVVSDSAHKSGNRLGRDFYEKSCGDLAKSLLGTVLVRQLDDGTVLRGKIVETESYPGDVDKASHSYNGKRTPRNEAMFMTPGTAYVYSIHTYVCLNISSIGDGAAVLLRALEPLCGLETMRTLRGRRRSDAGINLKEKELTNGPSKFAEAFAIGKEEFNKSDLVDNRSLWLESGEEVKESEIVTSARININCEPEWKEAKLRFYVLGNKFVSVRNKAAEKLLTEKC